jgi:phospholipase/carboxylesterase
VADVANLVGELRAPVGDAAGAIVLLHGRGTSEQDMLPLLDVFDPRERLVGALPRGPLQLPPIGYHWYSLLPSGG